MVDLSTFDCVADDARENRRTAYYLHSGVCPRRSERGTLPGVKAHSRPGVA